MKQAADNCLTFYAKDRVIVFETWEWDGEQKGDLIARAYIAPEIAARIANDLGELVRSIAQ